MTVPVVAVTGGTGFVGGHVLAALRAEGWHPRLLLRGQAGPPAGASAVRGDLSDPAALRDLVRGAAAVVHLAGLTKARSRAGFLAVNRDGSARLAAAVAAEAPAARCVLVSSLAARHPDLSPYAESKRAGEDAAVAALGAATPWTILRPGVVYGPGDREGLTLRRLAAGPLLPVPRDPEPRIGLVHARDLAAAIAGLCRAGPTCGRFEVTDHRHAGHGWREIIGAIRALLPGAGPPRFLAIPDGVFLAAGRLAGAWALATGRPALFGPGKARELLHRDWGSSPEAQLPGAFWRPRMALQPGLRDTAAWWAELGLQRRTEMSHG